MKDIKIIESNLNDAVKLLKELPVEQGELIHDYVDYALKLVKKHDFIDDVSNILPPLNTAKQEIEKYAETTINGDKGHFQNGINWALNYVAKKVKN
jgi:hypothetical protein